MLTFRDDAAHARLVACANDKPVVELHSFSDCRHRHRGPVFIVASGPSAAAFPLADYRHIPMIAMNGSLLRLQQDNIPAFFYLCDDPRFVKARHDVIAMAANEADNIALNAPSLERFVQLHPDCEWHANPYLLERVNRSWRQPRLLDRRYAWAIRHDPELLSGFSLLRNKPNRLGFSTNMTKGYYSARTIPYAALQLACHLGFSHAFLIGLDLSPELGRCYPEQGRVLKSTLHLDYDEFILPSFTFMQQHLPEACLPDTAGFNVYNLSHTSRLPDSVVPKLTVTALDTLLATMTPTEPTTDKGSSS